MSEIKIRDTRGGIGVNHDALHRAAGLRFQGDAREFVPLDELFVFDRHAFCGFYFDQKKFVVIGNEANQQQAKQNAQNASAGRAGQMKPDGRRNREEHGGD